jgi:hypothetical protein
MEFVYYVVKSSVASESILSLSIFGDLSYYKARFTGKFSEKEKSPPGESYSPSPL